MKNAIILHGRPSKAEYYNLVYPSMSNSHWLPWLQKQLLTHDIAAETPEIPLSYEPVWERWVKEVERYDITSETILIGHSCGAGFWVRYLSEHQDVRVGNVFLVAPWIDTEQEDPNHFFDFVIDQRLVARTSGLTIIHSSNDGPEMQSSVKVLRQQLSDIKYIELAERGHFTHSTMPTDEFPELLTEILK